LPATGERVLAQGARAVVQAGLAARLRRIPLFYKVLSANAAVVLLGALAGTWLSVDYARDFPAASPLALVAAFACVGTALSLAANFLLLKAALQPLEALERAVDEVRRGNLGARVRRVLFGDPRIDQLAETMNQMLDTLARQQAQAEALSSAVMRAQEEERKRISRDLHDQTAQALTSLLLRLSALERSSDPAVRTATPDLLALTAETLEEVRRLAFELRPALLDDLGLAPALAATAEQYQRRLGIPVTFRAERLGGRLAPEAELVLYRIAQEALTNVAKHAEARAVSLALGPARGRTRLVVQDDGRGFDPTAVLAQRERGLGLFGMQERAALVGATLSLESRPGAGTRVQVDVDLQARP